MHSVNTSSLGVIGVVWLAMVCAVPCSAENKWIGYRSSITPQPDIMSACKAAVDVEYAPGAWPWSQDLLFKDTLRFTKLDYLYINPIMATCEFTARSPYNPEIYGTAGVIVARYGTQCNTGNEYNPDTGRCDSTAGEIPRKQLGVPPFQGCESNTFLGNPINFSTGNKFQVEKDYLKTSTSPLEITRYYNSKDGVWRHTYSQSIFLTPETVWITLEDGRQIKFSRTGSVITSEQTELGTLKNTADGGWVYTSPNNERLMFTDWGVLVGKVDARGRSVRIDRTGATIKVTDEYGKVLTLKEYGVAQLLSAEAPGITINYTYNNLGELEVADFKRQGSETSEKRSYLYKPGTDKKLLIGLIDQRGVQSSTWAYDDAGRAISSEQAGGVGHVNIAYNNDGTVNVTNELGKSTLYQFSLIQGVRRVVSIVGHPSPNCPYSNSTFTYDSRGLVETKSDAEGHLTTYAYNERGFEVKRVEGAGSAQQRSISTEWDPVLPLKSKVFEPTRMTVFTYDGQGRPLSVQVTSN